MLLPPKQTAGDTRDGALPVYDAIVDILVQLTIDFPALHELQLIPTRVSGSRMPCPSFLQILRRLVLFLMSRK